MFGALRSQVLQPVFHQALAEYRQIHQRGHFGKPCHSGPLGGADQNGLHQHAPFPDSTAGTVFARILTSTQKVCVSMYSTSSSTWPEKSISLRPLICQMQVMPGLTSSRLRSASE